jgi:hypothetical protein
MPGQETARSRARDAARWLGVLRARGTSAPAISLQPDATKDLLSAAADPQRLASVCRRAVALIDRQIRAERLAPIALDGAPGAMERCGLRWAERQAAFATLRQQFAEIVAGIEGADAPG